MRLAILCFIGLFTAFSAFAAPTVAAFPVFTGDLFKVRVMVLVSGAQPGAKPEFSTHSAHITGVTSPPDLGGGSATALYIVDLDRDPQISSATLIAQLNDTETACPLPAAMDLSVLPWGSQYAGKELKYGDIGAPPGEDAAWKPAQVPETIQELGVTWLRVRMDIPESLRGTPLCVHIAAVDDNDVTFFNGQRIGATTGWDKLREYAVPDKAVRWGKTNTLCVAVHNQSWGGGIHRTPVLLIAGEKTELPKRYFDLPTQKEADRAPAGPVGPRPKPLQPLHVADGVLRYPDGAEPALWGVNYYTQSWDQYESLRKAGADHKQAIIDDFDDLERMNIDIVRIHVFDREISDGNGNLVPNDHLDLLDRIVAECDKRGIYLMLTPIAW